MTKKAKLKDIAEALGISITTVSRAINGKEDISTDTKKAVLAMVRELNYQPNNLAISLRRSDTLNLIGVIIPLVKHHYFSTLLQGILSRAKEANHFVILGESFHDTSEEKKIISDFIQHGVAGIILAPSKHSNFGENILPVIHRRIPVVIMDRMYNDYDGNYIQNDDFNGGYTATSHLISCGYRRIAHVGSSDSWSIGHERREGYKAALRDYGLKIDPNLIYTCDFNTKEEGEEEGYHAMHRFMALREVPDAIFSVTDDIAIGVYKYANEHKINIPDDLGVVGFSNSEVAQYLSPPLTTLEQFGQIIGQHAFDFFINALSGNGAVYQKTIIPKLIIRGSTRQDPQT